MKISKISLHNFRAAKDLDIDLHERMNLFVGVNGAGKSTVLQAATAAFIALVKKVHNSKNGHDLIRVLDIHCSEDQSSIEINLNYEEKSYSWKIERTRPGGNNRIKENHEELNQLSKVLKKKYKQEQSLPVLVYYPVDRTVEKHIYLIKRLDSQDEQLDVYNNALEGKPNFHNFFRWFRDQDDFINQKSLSRSRWIRHNASMLRRRISRIFSSFDQLLNKSASEAGFIKPEIHEVEFFLQEPRFLFREITKMIRMSEEKSSLRLNGVEELLYELDLMLHKMDMLPNEGQDSIADSKYNLFRILSQVLSQITKIRVEQSEDQEILDNIWQIFILSFEIGLWWLSYEGYTRLVSKLNEVSRPISQPTLSEADLQNFKDQIIETVKSIIEGDIRRRFTAQSCFGKDIQSVTRAIEQFVPEFSNLRINRNRPGSAQMLVDKNGKAFDIGQLSDGEKNIIALIGDIARRLTIGNPQSEDPLKETGIILIDEIDLHLHPKWQRIIAKKLNKVFPNCQFLISSHSPLVISHIKPESIVVLRNIEGKITKHFVNESFGKSSNRILEDIMDESSRPKDIDDKIKAIFECIQAGNIAKAQKEIVALRNSIGDDSDLVKAEVLIKRREILGK